MNDPPQEQPQPVSIRKRVYFTFGNHMHWVDMQWLWGYEVLPGSVRDMLHLCNETGIRGNVNFDGIGYEKIAAECPEALADLKEAVQAGVIEPVGCSYGQPYGLFQGGESNIRQFTYGVRTTRRLLGVRPRSFWEEEFYFYPQLPQVLKSCGFTNANLFFQWTWHTPEIPREDCALIQWEGIDGTRLPTLPRNELNLHQWPEDFGPMFESNLLRDLEAPAITQWIELMPSKDWMCRSEVLLPKLRELLANPDYEIQPGTMSEVISGLAGDDAAEVPVRRYGMDDVWHGMTLGKNADRHPRKSADTERLIRAAESLAATAGLLGRPYPSWSVYPTWELDEAWRELLAAQHHDNHECEGLCGFVGYQQMERAEASAQEVFMRTLRHLEDRVGAPLVPNPSGFVRMIELTDWSPQEICMATVPPFGFATLAEAESIAPNGEITLDQESRQATFSHAGTCVEIDGAVGLIRQITTPDFPHGILAPDGAALTISMLCDGEIWDLPKPMSIEAIDDQIGVILFFQLADDGASLDAADRGENVEDIELDCLFHIQIWIDQRCGAVRLSLGWLSDLPQPDGGLKSALRLRIAPAFPMTDIRADTPLAVGTVQGSGNVKRKYPQGDWMTSPQWFEELEAAFYSASFVDLQADDQSGVLIAHDGSGQWFRMLDGSVEVVLNAYDPWDEARYEVELGASATFAISTHAAELTDTQRIATAREFNETAGSTAYRSGAFGVVLHPSAVGGGGAAVAGSAPRVFGALGVENASNVLATAFYRDSMKAGEHFPAWAGHRMFDESNGACDHPYVLRLVEYDGEPADEIVVKLIGRVALAAKTNLLGEVVEGDADNRWLDVEYPVDPPDWVHEMTADGSIAVRGEELKWSAVRIALRPHEIATIMADLEMGRKEWRDLDARREVWATVHRDGNDVGST